MMTLTQLERLKKTIKKGQNETKVHHYYIFNIIKYYLFPLLLEAKGGYAFSKCNPLRRHGSHGKQMEKMGELLMMRSNQISFLHTSVD